MGSNNIKSILFRKISRKHSSRSWGSLAVIGVTFWATACGQDAAGPRDVIPLKRVTLEAVSPLKLTSIVGSTLIGQPSLRVNDSSGKPVPGVIVTFDVSGGGGIAGPAADALNPNFSYSSQSVVSNADGIASLGSWTIASRPGDNVVSASAPGTEPLKFLVEGTPGPVSYIRKEAGDEQYIAAQTAAVVRPQLRVFDAHHNALAGIPVTFSVLAGGGSITGGSTVTNGVGIAIVGSWTMGSAGAQVLSANVAGLERAETFTASIANSPRACGTPATLLVYTTIQAELSGESCRSGDGKYYDILTVNLPSSSAAYLFSLSSQDFDTYLEIEGDGPLAVNNDASGSTNSQIKAILPYGAYRLRITSNQPEKHGRYSISYTNTSEIVVACEDVFIARGVSSYQYSGSSDCASSGAGPYDRFRIFLKAGQPLNIRVEDLSYSYHGLVLRDASGKAVGALTPGTQWWILLLEFTAPADGYYFFEVSSADEGAEYTLTVQ